MCDSAVPVQAWKGQWPDPGKIYHGHVHTRQTTYHGAMAATTPQVPGFLPTPAAHRGPHTQVSGAQPLVLRTLHNLLFESIPVSPLLPLDFFPVLPTPSLLWNCQLVIPALPRENRKEVHYLNVHCVCAGRSQDVFSSHTTVLQLGIIADAEAGHRWLTWQAQANEPTARAPLPSSTSCPDAAG